MKTLVKKSLVLMLISLFVISASAQRPDRKSRMTAEERASKQTEMMTKLLDLTAEQQAKIKEIHLKYSQQRVEKKKQLGEEMKQNREKMKAQMEARNAELKQVLTPEQYEKWQEKRKEMRVEQGRNAKMHSQKNNELKE